MALVEFRDFSFRYSGAREFALKGIDLEIGRGEFVLITGASGCGKSTLLRSVIGLIPHMYDGDYVGEVLVSGRPVREFEVHELAERIGYVFQNPENQIFMFSVERDVAFGLENLGFGREEIRRRVDRAMDLMGIKGLANRAPFELSEGEKQRVAIAGVLAVEPDLLILDEPTSLLDPLTAKGLIEALKRLRKGGMTVVMVEHRLDLLSDVVDRVVVMGKGFIAADGSPEEVLPMDRLEGLGVGPPVCVRGYRRLRDYLGDGVPLSVVELAKRLNGVLG